MSDDVLLPIVTGVTGLVTGIIASSWRYGVELAIRYDIELRTKRLEAYAQLWSLLQPLAFHAATDSLTRTSVRDLSGQLLDWYFDVGGLYLARATQRRFLALQDALTRAVGEGGDGVLDAATLQEIRQASSALRTKMTRDVLSRRGSLLGRDRFTR